MGGCAHAFIDQRHQTGRLHSNAFNMTNREAVRSLKARVAPISAPGKVVILVIFK
ncbi:hypothetical protein REMIM1_PF00425 (plasmid) [Rhizobium etli bv. mimosae str. Mim1]|nr:hypothetical protein REMIM1_PF00425 [Rhizobium etli bv. mimosae str. Mim1]